MTDATISEAPVAPVAFVGGRGPLFWLVLRNTFLSLITLSFYRFWAKTWLRRYFWHGLAIDGEALEYTGRPVELLLGFLIVMAVLVPIGIVYSGLSVYLTTAAPTVAPYIDVAYFSALLVLMPYALYRARRYRMTRTLWRGVRCGQDGSPARYGFMSAGFLILNLITLGLAVPWTRTALQRFRTNNSRFGDRNFDFDGSGGALFKQWLPVVIVGASFVGLVLWQARDLILAAYEAGFGGMPDASNQLQHQLDHDLAEAIFVLSSFGGYVLLGGLAIILFVWYRVVEFRYFVSVTHLGDTEFQSQLRLGRVLGIGTIYVLVLILFVGMVLLISSIGGMLASPDPTSPGGFTAFTFMIALTIIVLMFFAPMARYMVLLLPLIRHATSTLNVTNMAHVVTIVQDLHAQPRYGEGLADALELDVDVF